MAIERSGEHAVIAHLLTVSDVAALCQVNAKTVQRAIRAGRLRASQLGARGAYRLRREDVDAWIDGSTVRVPQLGSPVDAEVRPRPMPRGRLVVGHAVGRVGS
jgi:excisionase family DNA binding protein